MIAISLALFYAIPDSIAAGELCPTFLNSMLSSLTPKQKIQLTQFLKNDPELLADATELLKLIPKIQEGQLTVRDPHLLDLVTRVTSKLQNTGKLPDILKALALEFKKSGKLPASFPPEKLDMMITMASIAIDAELSARGLTTLSKGVKYESWSNISTRLNMEIKNSISEILNKNPGKSGFEIPEFVKVFEKQTGSKFSNGNEVKLLIDGPTAFAERTRLIELEKKKIHVMSWAFYDDVTGKTYADLFIKKAKEGVDVRVMVDGQVTLQPKYNQMLKKMEENGVKIVRWRSTNPQRRFDGQHRKFIVFGDQQVIGGGMNFGDEYSHLGAEHVQKWRDTDYYLKGPSAVDAENLFAKLWNEQNTNSKLQIRKSKNIQFSKSNQSTKVSFINHQPGQGENIYRANLMAIEGATKTIDIENAYFILDPATYKALLRAKKRGVRVRILTNSAQSVDEPIVSYPIMETVNRLAQQNFEVYVKKGTTLHTKAMTVDGLYSWIGSHNFHPRSFRYEGELTMNALDANFAKKVEEMFQTDINQAIQIKEPVKLPSNLQADVVGFYLYDQL